MSGERSVWGDERENIRGDMSRYRPGMAQEKFGHAIHAPSENCSFRITLSPDLDLLLSNTAARVKNIDNKVPPPSSVPRTGTIGMRQWWSSSLSVEGK